MSTSIRVLTYNIHKGMDSGNRRFVLQTIKESLLDVSADIVMLQEVHGKHASARKNIRDWPDNNQFEYLADAAWPHHAYGKNAIYQRGHHGNAILSKYPFVSFENIDVSMMRRASRSILHGVIEMPDTGQRMHLMCIHLGLFNFERDKQLQRLAKQISDIPQDEPIIVAGDFNDWRGRASRYFEGLGGLTEIFHHSAGRYAQTFPSWMPVLRMDRVYVRGVGTVRCEQLQGKPWSTLSDHIPLLAELEL